MFKGDGEYDKSDEETVGTTSPFLEPGDLDCQAFFHIQSFVFHPMWSRFVPGTLGWRHSSAEMLFILMEGGSSGKARCSLSIYLLEKSFESFFVPGH